MNRNLDTYIQTLGCLHTSVYDRKMILVCVCAFFVCVFCSFIYFVTRKRNCSTRLWRILVIRYILPSFSAWKIIKKSTFERATSNNYVFQYVELTIHSFIPISTNKTLIFCLGCRETCSSDWLYIVNFPINNISVYNSATDVCVM